MMALKKVKAILYLNAGQKKRLKALAKEKGESMSVLVREAIQLLLDNEDDAESNTEDDTESDAVNTKQNIIGYKVGMG